MAKFLKHFTPKMWLAVVAILALVVGQVYLDLKIPDYMSDITELLQKNGTVNDIISCGLKMLALAIASGILAVIVGYITARMSATLAKNLRKQTYNKVASFSPSEINKFSIASLITRSTNDVSQVQQSVAMGLQILLKAPVLAIWAILKIVNKNWQWSLATSIAILSIILGVTVILLFAVPHFKKMQRLTDDLNRVTRENLTGLRVVRAFNAENYMETKFDDANNNLKTSQLKASYAMSFLNPLMQIVMNGLSLAIYLIGAHLISNALLPEKITLFSDMVVFFSYAMQVISACIMLIIIFMILPRATVSFKRIQEVLDVTPSITDGKGAKPTEVGTFKFNNVSFCYQDAKEPVLKNITFEAKQGEKIAIIGATGSGKSTIIKLLPRLYDVTDGEVLVDGENVKNYTIEELHDKIGYISQKPMLMSGTVQTNVAMGKVNGEKVSLDNVKKAIEYSESQSFVNAMDKTIDAEIYQGGTNVSGGQKQRLSIARALAREPEILIFDDSFSALDFKTDLALRRTLNSKLPNSTCVIVTQRVATVKDCDKIVVIDNGEIVGIGKHFDLLENCKVYKEIALSQLSEEELNYGKK